MKINLKDLLPFSKKENLISESLSILKEIQLNPENSADIKGDVNKGTFTIDNIIYDYEAVEYPSNIILPGDKDKVKLEGTVYDLGFTEHGGGTDFASNLPKGGKANLIKIYSTLYKVLLTLTKEKSPNNILLSSYDESGYFPYYNTLTKTNNTPGYSRKSIIKWKHKEKNITSIVLKKNN